MLKRSLTLLEMLVALVLVLAMGAVIVPMLTDSLDERAFDLAADETNEQLMMARAHAQATGSPVEVTYDAKKSQVCARLFSPWDAVGTTGESNQSVQEPWALRVLGRGVRIVAKAPKDVASGSNAADESVLGPDDFESLEDLGKGQQVRLAVFMPDGTALLGHQVWLNDAKGRLGVFTINQWNGLPFFERLANLNSKKSETGRK